VVEVEVQGIGTMRNQLRKDTRRQK
jgi:hypothetical protein